MVHYAFMLLILSSASLVIATDHSSQASPPEKMITLISSDSQKFIVPLEIARQVPAIEATLQLIEPLPGFTFDKVTGEVLSEIAQLMQELSLHKNLSPEEFFEKFENSIPIKDNLAFAIAVKHIGFKPGIDFIAQKYEQLDDYYFPSPEYDYWMKLIEQTDSTAFEQLKKCGVTYGKPCLEMAIDQSYSLVVPGEEESHGYPFLLINPDLKLEDAPYVKSRLESVLTWYKHDTETRASAITPDEQSKVMEIIKDLAPPLYQEMIAVDPTGAHHIKRYYGGSNAEIAPSALDGLPEIRISADFSNQPKSMLRVLMAHELGHYALVHFNIARLTHEVLEKNSLRQFKKGKRVSGQLGFEESFAHAFSRTQEYEADKFAVLELGIPLDDAIAWAKKEAQEAGEVENKAPSKMTFTSTHPFWTSRIKQFEELRPEIELNKAHNKKPIQVQWKQLAEQYIREIS